MSDDILILGEQEKSDKNLGLNDEDFRSFGEKANDWLLSIQSLSSKDKVVFYRLLSTMINAGISLIKSLKILEKQEKNLVLRSILARFIVELKTGKNLSECFLLYPESFGNAEVGIIESGEKTGKLNDALQTLANQVEKVESMNGKIKSALMYPLMVIVVVFGVMGIMMTVVVPKLLDIFEDKSKLPTSTKTLMVISDIFVNYWWLMLMLIFGGIIILGIWKKTPTGMYKWNQFMFWLPVFGDLNQKVVLSKFARVLSGLISSGVSIVESLRITSEAVGSEVYRQRIMLLRVDVKQGMKIGESLEGDKLFPDMMVQMIQVGEQTAQLDKIIIKVADFYDEQVDNTVGTINKLLEPIIIVFMAVMVGGIAVGIMEPIMNLADTISNS